MKQALLYSTLLLILGNCLSCKHSDAKKINLIDLNNKNRLEIAVPAEDAKLMIGQGYSSATNDGKGMVVDFDPDSDHLITVNNSQGQTVYYYFERIRNIDQLSNFLNINYTSSLRWGIASAEAKSNFITASKFNSYSDYICAKITVSNPPGYIKSPEINAEALRRARAGQDELMKYAGDEYVKGVQTGGELILLYQYTATSNEQREQIQAKLEASVGGFIASAKTAIDFQKTVAALDNLKSERIYVFRTGDYSEIKDNSDSLIAYVNRFPQIIHDLTKAAPLYFFTESIQYLKNIPLRNTDFNKIYDQREFLTKLSKQMIELITIRNNIQYIEQNRDLFKQIDDRKLSADKDLVENNCETIRKCASACLNNFNSCQGCSVNDIDINKIDKYTYSPFPEKPTMKTVAYTNANRELFITDINDRYISLLINGNWSVYSSGTTWCVPISQGHDWQDGNIAYRGRIIIRDLNNNLVKDMPVSQNVMVLENLHTKVYLRTVDLDHYRNNQEFSMYSCKENPIIIQYW